MLVAKNNHCSLLMNWPISSAGLYDEGSLQGYIITVVTTEIKSAQSPITGT